MIQDCLSIMQDNDLRKAFGTRIKELRKKHGWTQKELASKLEIRFSLLNKYESGLHTPPMEKLIQLAELFHTTVDYLMTGNYSEAKPLHNLRLLERFRAVESFQSDDQETVMKLIDAMVAKTKLQEALNPYEKQAI